MDRKSLLLLLELLHVELELSAFEKYTISAAALAGAAGDTGKHAPKLELVLNGLFDAVRLLSVRPLALHRSTGLAEVDLRRRRLLGLLLLVSEFLLCCIKVKAVLLCVEELEGRCIHGDDAVLHQCLCADELVGCCVVDDVKDTGTLGNTLGTPSKVASVETEGANFVVPSANADGIHLASTELSVRREAAKLVLSLLAMDRSQVNVCFIVLAT